MSYFKKHGISSGALIDYLNYRQSIERPRSYDMELGHAFELVLFDELAGNSLRFAEKYFVLESNGSPSSAADIISGAIVGNLPGLKLNKDGSPNRAAMAHNNWVQECIDHPGRIPIRQDDYAMLRELAGKMLRLEVTGVRVESILPGCIEQAETYWQCQEGLTKKALPDLLLQSDSGTWIFDLKLYASHGKFRSWLRSGGWIQDIHYCEGVDAVYSRSPEDMVDRMHFLVASKEAPILCQEHVIDFDSRDAIHAEYKQLCQDYSEWVSAGSQPIGWLDRNEIKIYNRKD